MVRGFWSSLVSPVVSASSLVSVCHDVICSWRRLGRTCGVHTPCTGDCGWWCACMCGLCKVWVWSISSLCKERSYWSVRNYLPYTIRFHFEELSRIHLEHLSEIFIHCIKEFSIVYHNRFRPRPGVHITFSHPQPDVRGSYILVVFWDHNVPYIYNSIIVYQYIKHYWLWCKRKYVSVFLRKSEFLDKWNCWQLNFLTLISMNIWFLGWTQQRNL